MRYEDLLLDVLIERSRARFANMHPKHTLLCELDGPVPVLRGDPALLRRALDNLLDNAAAYSESDRPITLRLRVQAEQVQLSVEDHGIGIGAEHLPNIGRPFYRTHRSRARRTGGLGLGVSLSRRIAEAHDGTLTLESEVGVGTRAFLRLPRKPRSATPPA
jgi:signal transduction histidine kinase